MGDTFKKAPTLGEKVEQISDFVGGPIDDVLKKVALLKALRTVFDYHGISDIEGLKNKLECNNDDW